jgi:selenocysteine-specific elongation factor
VIDPKPKGRHKRFHSQTLSRLEALTRGTPTEILLQALLILGAAPLQDVIIRSELEKPAARLAVDELTSGGQLVNLEERVDSQGLPTPDALVSSKGYWEQQSARILGELEAYHLAFPLRRGIPREELKSRMKLAPRVFTAVIRRMAAAEDIEEIGPFVQKKGHAIRFSEQQQSRADSLLQKFASSPFSPPSVKESQAEVGEEVYNALTDTGVLYALSNEVVLHRQDYDQMVSDVRRLLEKQGVITAAEVRDHFNTSRRYVLALLEHLDAKGITVREGDARRLRK